MEYTDLQILDFKIGETTIQAMGALSFLAWIAKKINGVSSFSAANQELVMAVTAPPFGGRLEDSEKIRLVRKMLSIGITL